LNIYKQNLKKNTDHLSSLYEKSLDNIQSHDQYTEWKEEVTNYTRITKHFLNKFVEGVMDGLVDETVSISADVSSVPIDTN